MEKLITRKEAAEILGISIATLDAARNNGFDLLCAVCSEWLCVFYCGRSPGVYRKMHAQSKTS